MLPIFSFILVMVAVATITLAIISIIKNNDWTSLSAFLFGLAACAVSIGCLMVIAAAQLAGNPI